MHVENLLFLLLIAVALLFQWLTRAASKATKDQKKRISTSSSPEEPPPIRRKSIESDQERIRKFLEALGQPTTAQPPPPVAPHTNIPPRPLAPIRPPPGLFSFPRGSLTPEDRRKKHVILHETQAQPPVLEVQQQKEQIRPLSDIKRPEQHYAMPTDAKMKDARTGTNIRGFLGSATELRSAIILREILGPPRGLKEFELP